MRCLVQKIGQQLRPVYISPKLKDQVMEREPEPFLLSQQCVIYYFTCDQCEADYIRYTSRYLHQRIEEHKNSVIGKHIKDVHLANLDNMDFNFTILRKCKRKFDCLIFEMLFIRDLKPSLNTLMDSIKAKLFV